eukprot:symbB.v1.2.036260.t1/scaffold5077.1/size31199/3
MTRLRVDRRSDPVLLAAVKTGRRCPGKLWKLGFADQAGHKFCSWPPKLTWSILQSMAESCDEQVKKPLGCIVEAANANKHELVIQHLQQDPERIRHTDRDGFTCLHHVARKGHSVLAKELLRYRADVKAQDQWGMTPLHRAVAKGHVTLVEQLLSARAELRAKNARGLTPVDFARAHQDDKVRQILANFASQ